MARLAEPFAADLVCVPLAFLERVQQVMGDPAAHRLEAEELATQLGAFLGSVGPDNDVDATEARA